MNRHLSHSNNLNEEKFRPTVYKLTRKRRRSW